MRSCYEATMQFDKKGEIKVPIVWYFCGDGAELFPGPHSFGSSNWENPPRSGLGIGEQWDSSFAWRDGSQPFPAPGNGSFCGPLDWYENGCPSDAPPVEYVGDIPECCPQPACQEYFAPEDASTCDLQWEQPGVWVRVTWDFSGCFFLLNGSFSSFIGWHVGDFCPGKPYLGCFVETISLHDFPTVDGAIITDYDEVTGTGTWVGTAAGDVVPGVVFELQMK